MFQGFFIPGLVSFLVAHLFYVALFKRGQAWFRTWGRWLPPWALAACTPFVDGRPAPALRVPVAAYVLVIALMAAQAMGLATSVAQRASTAGGAGGGCFMLSDALLATDRFVTPCHGPVWVLSTYYAAQVLIVSGWLAREAPKKATAST